MILLLVPIWVLVKVTCEIAVFKIGWSVWSTDINHFIISSLQCNWTNFLSSFKYPLDNIGFSKDGIGCSFTIVTIFNIFIINYENIFKKNKLK